MSPSFWVEGVSLQDTSEQPHVLLVIEIGLVIAIDSLFELLLEEGVRVVEVLEVILAVKREIRVTRGRLYHQIIPLQSHHLALLSLLDLQLHQRLQQVL